MTEMIEYPEIELNFALAPKTEATVFLAKDITPLEIDKNGPFIRNQNGQLLCVYDKTAYLSDNDGKDWQEFEIFNKDQKFSISNSYSLLCTTDGTLIVSFVNIAHYTFKWRKKTNTPTKTSELFHYVVRSEDGGKTWQEPILLQKGYAAAATTLIQLKSGAIIASAQNMFYQQARHYSLTLRSEDDGKNWQASNILDIGGQGHHDGCYEGTVVELEDKVWFCIRTNLDYFWNAYSEDDGKNWTIIEKGLEASSSPAMLKRLQSGRLLMVYNPLYPQGQTEFHRVSGQFSVTPASWFREDLVAIYSEDDGKNWSEPFILAQCKKAWLSYPYVFENQPGEIWLTTMQSELRIKFKEADLINAK